MGLAVNRADVGVRDRPTGMAPARRYASVHLDAVRGIAALAVLAYHIRYIFFPDYSEIANPSLAVRLFYVLTSYGHDAVMVFFVLSGYLISGTILKDVKRRTWSWTGYLINRLVRLYVVLLPGLLLTLFWDSLGMHLFPNHPAYTGAPQTWINDFYRVADRLTPSIFFANIGFLHAIAGIPPFGTAAQLWSLTYEFAYYLIFPAALLAVWPKTSWSTRLICVAATLMFSYHFGSTILWRFPIWLLGFLVNAAPPMRWLEHRSANVRGAVVALFIVGGISATHLGTARAMMGGGSLLVADYVIGIVFAAGLYVLLHDSRPAVANRYVRLAQAAANLSFTLYVFHMSLLIFLRAVFVKGAPWAPTAGNAGLAALIFFTAVAYSALMWYMAEARTDGVRQFFLRRAARHPLLGVRIQHGASGSPASTPFAAN
jgi:peptidoglycan/LPS O-acetylase OafA/YrhL